MVMVMFVVVVMFVMMTMFMMVAVIVMVAVFMVLLIALTIQNHIEAASLYGLFLDSPNFDLEALHTQPIQNSQQFFLIRT